MEVWIPERHRSEFSGRQVGYEATAHDWNWRLAGSALGLHSRRSDQRALAATIRCGTANTFFPGSNVPRYVAAAAYPGPFVQSRDRTAAGTSVVAILCAPAQSPRTSRRADA